MTVHPRNPGERRGVYRPQLVTIWADRPQVCRVCSRPLIPGDKAIWACHNHGEVECYGCQDCEGDEEDS